MEFDQTRTIILKCWPIVVIKKKEILQFVVGVYSQGRYTYMYVCISSFFPLIKIHFEWFLFCSFVFFFCLLFFIGFYGIIFFLLQFHFFIFPFIATNHCCYCRSRRCCHRHCCRQSPTSHWQFSCPVLAAIKAKQNAWYILAFT